MRVSIEINKDNFKLCAVDQGKQVAQLIKKDFAAILSEAEIGELIKKTLRELNLKIDSISCVLPRHQATVRLIKLPSLVKEELVGMIDIQTVRLIPYPKEEIIYDYEIIAEENNEYSWVKVGIVHRKVISRILGVVNVVGLVIESITLSTDAALGWLTVSSGIKDDAFVLVNIDESFLDVEVVYRSNILFSRSISFENTKLEPAIVTEEIKKTITGFKKEEIFLVNPKKLNVTQVVLMGLKENIESLKPNLSTELSLEVSTFVSGVFNESNEDLKSAYEKGSFCGVLGVSFSERKMLNFVPLEVRAGMKTATIRKHFIFLGVLGILSLTILFSIIFTKINNRQKLVNYLKKQIAEQESLVADIKAAKARLAVIKEWNTNKKICIDMLRELYQITPNEISLTVLSYDVNTPLVLQGSAQKMSDIFKYVSILEQSGYFQNVQIRYATKRKIRNRELTDFQINCPFEKK